MDIKAARRIPGHNVLDRLNFGGSIPKNGICRYWAAGSCKRNDCRFLHPEAQAPQSRKTWKNPNYHVPTAQMTKPKDVQKRHQSGFDVDTVKKNHHAQTSEQKDLPNPEAQSPQSRKTWENPNYHIPTAQMTGSQDVQKRQKSGFDIDTVKKPHHAQTSEQKDLPGTVKKPEKQLCKYWVTGNCVHGENCKNLHSWYHGDGFTMLAKLEGHTKAITGVALPSGSDKLYSVSKDKSMRIWDCHTGHCGEVITFDDECGTLMCEGPCLFVGLPNVVKAWNLQAQAEVALNGPVVGQVYVMDVGNDMFFAGAQDGTISVWKSNSSEVFATLKGHSGAVVSLVFGANRLYSGSMDKTIKVWDLQDLKCLQTLHGHSDVVMSVLCWDSFLLSGSLDGRIKVWAANETGKLEVVHESNEEHGVLRFCGITDAEAKPILLCSCNDNSVRLYDLPSFTERGRIYSKADVRTLQIGTGGLFFTGDATGQLTVWKLDEKTTAVVSS